MTALRTVYGEGRCGIFLSTIQKIYQALNYKKTYFPIFEAERSSRTTSSTRFHDVTFKDLVMFILTALRAMNMIMKNSNESPTHSTSYVYFNYST